VGIRSQSIAQGLRWAPETRAALRRGVSRMLCCFIRKCARCGGGEHLRLSTPFGGPDCERRATMEVIVMTNASSASVPEPVSVTPELLAQHSITADEYKRIQNALGREPSLTELGIYSVMWSEHCSYKSSRVHLKRLPTKSDRVVQGPGENAGIIDVGEAGPAPSRSRATTTPATSSPIRARPPAWAGFCATSSRWARGRWRDGFLALWAYLWNDRH